MEKKQNPADLSEQEKEVLLELIYVRKKIIEKCRIRSGSISFIKIPFSCPFFQKEHKRSCFLRFYYHGYFPATLQHLLAKDRCHKLLGH